jgi:hypothetical protein
LDEAVTIYDDDEITPETANAAAQAFIERLDGCPDSFAGRGIVICAGGSDHFAGAYLSVRLLRALGCGLPVQIWHLGRLEIDEAMEALLGLSGDVECVDALGLLAEFPARILNGWELKPYAILHCPFRDVMLIDADNFVAADPERLFDDERYQSTGALFWPIGPPLSPDNEVFQMCGLPWLSEPEFDSSQIVVDKSRCWEALNLCMWYNEHSDLFYNYVFGDRETFHLAFRRVASPYAICPVEPRDIGEIRFQCDPDGNVMFQHWGEHSFSALVVPDKMRHAEILNACLSELHEQWDGVVRADGHMVKRAVHGETLHNGADSTSAMFTRPYRMRVFTHDRGGFESLTGSNVLLYWPHGFGDWVFLSYVLPLLEPSNNYFVTRFGDHSVSLYEGNPYATPLYAGISTTACDDGGDLGNKHFGLDYSEIDGSETIVTLPEALYVSCASHGIDAMLWTWFPEIFGTVDSPFHTKARNLLPHMVSQRQLGRFDLNRPLASSLDLNPPAWLAHWVDARLTSIAGITGKKLCLICRSGFTAYEKNWGHLFREDLPAGSQHEGEECRDFMRLLRQKDPRWVFVVIEDRFFSGWDTVRSRELNCFSYAELFGSLEHEALPFGLVMKALTKRADLSIGVPAGPYHLSMACPELPTIGLWMTHLPVWYDEPKDSARHLLSRNVADTGLLNRAATQTAPRALQHQEILLDTRIITGEQVLGVAEELIY